MSILSKQAISEAIEAGNIYIDPFNPTQLNSGSYDLRLGTDVKVYKRWVKSGGKYPFPADFRSPGLAEIIDAKEKPETISYTIHDRFLLLPGILYLMHTEERVCARKYVPVLDGKSSIGRLGIKVHFCAGYGDSGFDGQYTLEVEASGPVFVYPKMRIAQIRFHEIQGAVCDYKEKGHYVDRNAIGAVASQAYRQLQEDGI